MLSQQRINDIIAIYGLLLSDSSNSSTSIQEIGPVDNPESLQNPIQSFFCQRWPRNRNGFWWCGSGLHIPWRAAGHWNKIFIIFNLMNTTQCLPHACIQFEEMYTKELSSILVRRLPFGYTFNLHCCPTTHYLSVSYC